MTSGAALRGEVLGTEAADLLALTAALVGVPSESHAEAEIADLVAARLNERAPGLTIERVGTNVIARTDLGRERRVVLGVTSTPCPRTATRRPVSRGTCSGASVLPT